MNRPGRAELEAAEQLLVALQDFYDVSAQTLEPIVPGHPVHVAVGNWRQSLPNNSLTPDFSRLRSHLWKESKVDREKANSIAEDFAESLIQQYPSLADEETGTPGIVTGGWFDSPPPPDSRFKHGPVSGQLHQLSQWIAAGEPRTLAKHNAQGIYYITKDHSRRFSVWFSSLGKLQEVQRRQHAENA
jgi:hypothetical protein